MRIRMLETRLGVANALGSRTLRYLAGETYAMTEPWQRALAAVFVGAGWAETLEPAPARAGRRAKRSTQRKG